ncbi:MAG: hypothetical protein ACRD29_15485 [Acidimicrobiales bacterium]
MPYRHRPRRWILAAGAAAAAAAVVAAGCGDGGAEEGTTERVPESGTLPLTTTTAPADVGGETTTTSGSAETTLPLPGGELVAVVEITVVGDEVSVTWTVTGNEPIESREIQVGVNTPVTILATADRDEEVHVHGYDLKADVAPGVAGLIEFTADTAGLFEIELEGSHLLLAQLQVG